MIYPYQKLNNYEFSKLLRMIFHEDTKKFRWKITNAQTGRTCIVLDKRSTQDIIKDEFKIKRYILKRAYNFKTVDGINANGHLLIELPNTIVSYILSRQGLSDRLKLSKTIKRVALKRLKRRFRDFDWNNFAITPVFKYKEKEYIEKHKIEGHIYPITNYRGLEFKLADSERVK